MGAMGHGFAGRWQKAGESHALKASNRKSARTKMDAGSESENEKWVSRKGGVRMVAWQPRGKQSMKVARMDEDICRMYLLLAMSDRPY